MPLWGRKLYQPRANERKKNSKPALFSIPFTEEVFDSETEYKEQLALYQQPLWTCQSSGRSGLTYEEAHMSEVKNKDLLEEIIPVPLQKAILQLIHHSTGSLDTLVQRVEDQLNSQFHVGEVVELAKCKGKIVKGKVLQVKTDQVSNGGKACNGSPSSDKENHSLEPELLLNSKLSKNVPCFYNIQIIGKENKVISSVPASDLIRCNDTPSPEHIALLIRSYALQAGTKQSSPWVVTPDVVKNLGIRNKLIETMLPSTRISIRGLKGAVKRRTSNEGTNQQNKKLKLENGVHTPTKTDSNPVMVVDMESEEYRDSSLPPSPEKVFLDHSYSSPQSKAGKAPPSPKEKTKKPSLTGKSPKLTKKSSILKAMEAVKTDNKQNKVPAKRAKKSQMKAEKDSTRKKIPKKKPKKEKIEDEVEIISDSDSSSDSESSSDSDSDIVLLDLSKKLSPQKGKKVVVPVRRTLTDHFLSMKDKKCAKSTTGRTTLVKEIKLVGKSEGGKKVNEKPSLKVKRESEAKQKPEMGVKEKVKEVVVEEAKRDRKNDKAKSKVVTKSDNVVWEKGKGGKKSGKEVSKKEAEEEKFKRTSPTVNSSDKVVKKTPTKAAKLKEQQKSSKVSPLKSSPKKTVRTPSKTKTPVKKGKLSAKSPLKMAKVPPKKKAEVLVKKNGKGSTNAKSPLKTKSPVKSKSPAKSVKVSPKKNLSGKKTPVKSKTSPLKSPKSKSMKQVTLFNFSTKKKVQPEYSSSDDDALILYKVAKPATPITPREPPIAAKLMKAKKANDQTLYNRLVGQAAKMLTKKQIYILKPLIQQDVMNKAQALEARNKWLKMTPEERKKVLEAKRGERKKQKEEERKKRLAEEKEKAKRFEDQLLDLPPLIVPKPVALPEGIPNTLFGDIAMVVEFLNCYGGLLMPNDPYPVTTDSFMKALVCGKEGFAYLSRMLVILLKTLLQDQITEHFMDVGMKLSDIPVNMHTASELLRLSLRQTDTEEEQTDDESDTSSVTQEEGEFTAPQELVELLETSEFFSLTPEVKLELMVCLCNRILSTYSLVDYMEDKQRKATKLWNQKMQTLKLKNDQKREEKKKLREEREAAQKQKKEEEERLKAEKDKNGGKLPDALKPAKKKAKKEEPKETAPAPPPEEEPDDLASIVKRRRILAAKAKLEQEEQAKKDLERRIQEQEDMKLQREKQIFEKNFEEGIHQAKMVLRQQPIGTDRNHSRYWIFSTVTPGLFIEKGWASQDIDYCCATSGEEGEGENRNVSENHQSDNTKLEDGVEKSIPKVGQNLWFQYDNLKEVDALMECLNNAGIRERALYQALQKRYNDISKLIFQSRRSGLQLRDSDGPKELLDSFKEDLKDIEMHIRQGHLGGVLNFEKWEKRLESATKIKELSTLMLESQASVNTKFLQFIMAPQRSKVKQEDEDEDAEEMEERSDKLMRWIESVKVAPTMSRLHVLLSIFEVCIKWEKSSENARCKICRKKGDASQILLCDDCNQPFHSFCLRPALSFPPSGQWKCPSCAPTSQRAGRKRNYKDMLETESEDEEEDDSSEADSVDDDDDDDEDDDDGEVTCCVCGVGEETISCSQCNSAYHKDCHQPPMRNFPRGKWTCYSCIHGKKKRRGKRKGSR